MSVGREIVSDVLGRKERAKEELLFEELSTPLLGFCGRRLFSLSEKKDT